MRLPSLLAAFSLPFLALAADPPASDPQAEAVLSAFAKLYSGANTLQTRISTTLKIDAKGRQTDSTLTYDLSVARPNSLALVLIEGKMSGTIITDGVTQAVYLPVLKRYTTGPAPKSLDALLPPVLQSMVLQGIPFGYEPLLTPDITAALHKNATSITLVGPADVNGTPAQEIKIDTPRFLTRLWIATGDQPLLLKSEIALNISPAASQPQIKEFRRTTTFTDWKLNQPIPSTTFQFQPPADAEKAETLFLDKSHPANPSPSPAH